MQINFQLGKRSPADQFNGLALGNRWVRHCFGMSSYTADMPAGEMMYNLQMEYINREMN